MRTSSKYDTVSSRQLTFHDVDDGADVALLDDERPPDVLDGVHAVHDLLDLTRLQVLHEVVVHDGALDQGPRPGTSREEQSAMQDLSLMTNYPL